MNWKECVGLLERYDLGDRFTWPPNALSFDCSKVDFTISDVSGGIAWVWTLPGDYVLSQEPLRTFFEIDGSQAVGTVSSYIIGWLLFSVLMYVMMLFSNDYS